MELKRVVLFIALVAMCIAASSIGLYQSMNKKYHELKILEQNGDPEAAKAGLRNLAMKYPYTQAGLNAFRNLVEKGEPPLRLATELLKTGVRNTTAGEWLVLLSTFLVVTVFMGSNILPPVTLLLFIISGAGMFHLSHPLVSIDSVAFNTFIAINPFLYIALTLLIAAGYLYRRWEIAGQTAYQNAFVREKLTFSEQLLIKARYAERLKALLEHIDARKIVFQTPNGRHYVKETRRIYETVLKDQENKRKELESSETRSRKIIDATREAIDRTQLESMENKIRFQSKAIDRKEYKRIKLEKESTLKECRRRISELDEALVEMRKVRFGNRLQFMRRDLFISFLQRSFIERTERSGRIHLRKTELSPQTAKKDIARRRVLYRKSSDAGARLIKLEKRRGKMKETVYKAKLIPLTNEKKIVDRELMELEGKISERLKSYEEQQALLQDTAGTLSAELADIKALGNICYYFSSHIESRRRKIRRDIKLCRDTLKDLRKVIKIYRFSTK